MNKFYTLSSAVVLSVAVAGSVVAPAYAWHPEGKITKSVQNMTSGGQAKDANTAETAVIAKPGDILQYTIEVTNVAKPAANNWNDLAHGVITDKLPEGVELVSDPSVREIKATMPTILPGNGFTKQFQVKVTGTTDGKIVENIACYTADSLVKDNPQKGCDTANVKVAVPVTPVVEAPAAPVTPAPAPVTPVQETPAKGGGELAEPTVLPEAGVGSTAIVTAVAATVFGFLASRLRNVRRLAA
ncbi:MAG TPA: hypothetical protein VF572_07395 [Candidatus Saccharimonadales bacterium]|jgi:uncharacterized repeat protein (TIGR01451 family)